MKKLLFAGLTVFGLSLFAIGFNIEKAQAASISTFDIKPKSMHFVLVNDDNATFTPFYFTLPPLSGNNGTVYVVRGTGGTANSYALVRPASGEKIDNRVDLELALAASGNPGAPEGYYAQLLADEASGTWWVIGYGLSSF